MSWHRIWRWSGQEVGSESGKSGVLKGYQEKSMVNSRQYGIFSSYTRNILYASEENLKSKEEAWELSKNKLYPENKVLKSVKLKLPGLYFHITHQPNISRFVCRGAFHTSGFSTPLTKMLSICYELIGAKCFSFFFSYHS